MTTDLVRLHASPAEDTRRRIVCGQALLDYGVPEHLHAAWYALYAILMPLPPADQAELLRHVPAMPALSAALAAAMDAVVAQSDRPCTGCGQIFEAAALCESPWRAQTFEQYCAPCAAALDRTYAAKRAKHALRSARSRAAGDLTEAAWAETCAYFEERCAYCAVAHWRLVEHATPPRAGGRTTSANCVPACFSCSAQKGHQTLEELLRAPKHFDPSLLERIAAWLQSRGRGAK